MPSAPTGGSNKTSINNHSQGRKKDMKHKINQSHFEKAVLFKAYPPCRQVVGILLSALFCLLGFQARGLMDTKNANYTKTFVDVALPGSGLPLMIERTYNSRSLYMGMFGYGWCSNLETRLEVMPDNTLLVVECGGGAEIPYASKASQGNRSQVQAQIMAEVKKKKGLTRKYIAQVERDLKKSSLLQSELIRAFGLKGKAISGQTYHAQGRQNERVQFNGQQYKRFMANGEIQVFNQQGQLIQEMDKSGNWIRIRRKKGQITKVMDSKGRSLRFKSKKGLLTVSGPGGIKMAYVIKGDNLVSATNSKKEKYQHFYDGYHNLTKTRYPDGTYEALTYNIDKDWVTSFRDRRQCRERYKYSTNPRNKDHYWTTVRKICGKKVTNNSRYEFWNKNKKDGSGKYLFRARQEVNGRISDITYDEATGSPLSITRNRIRIRYAYYPNGFLKSRSDPGKQVFFANYGGKCKKPSQVVVKYIRGRKVVRQMKTQLSYDPVKCHLTKAQQSTGRWVVVQRDHLGRISQMRDQSKKTIIVAYNEKFSKPSRITRPGVGAIQVFYNKDGEVDARRTRSDPTVAAQVANVFNGFLELISPVATDITI